MTVDIPEHNIVEPDQGETAIATTCFSLEISTPNSLELTLTHTVSNTLSTPIEGVDFTFAATSITVRANFIGNVNWCVNVTIIGNNEFDGNRRVNLILLDMPSDDVAINILEDDGRCKYNYKNFVQALPMLFTVVINSHPGHTPFLIAFYTDTMRTNITINIIIGASISESHTCRCVRSSISLYPNFGMFGTGTSPLSLPT